MIIASAAKSSTLALRRHRNIGSTVALITAITAAVSWHCASHAATVTWGAAQNISGDTDVSTLGTLVQAASIGSSDDPGSTVNGVLFAPFVMNNGPSPNISGHFTMSPAGSFIGGGNQFGYNAAPYNTLSTAYQTLLNFGDYTNSNDTTNLTLTGLTFGKQYLFEWWTNESGGTSQAPFTIPVTATSGNAVTLLANTTGTHGGTGQFAIGTFVADGTTQLISFQGTASASSTEEALLLRDITGAPEPGTWTMLGLGLPALLGFRRRRARIEQVSASTGKNSP